jgi:chromosome segregation ATPase
MAKSDGRITKMSIADFHRYLDEKRRELEACYTEVEEVRAEFDAIFRRELVTWQEKFAFCFPRVAEGRKTLPAAFATQLDRIEVEETARLRQELADLAGQITAGRVEMDRLTAEAQAAVAHLREANPELDRQEEQLKAAMVKDQDRYAELFEQIEALERRFLGGMIHFIQINKLNRQQDKIKRRQAQTLQKLRTVRKEWQQSIDGAGETQAALREQWQAKSIEVSRAQSRRDHVAANLAVLAEEAAIQRLLAELDTPPDVPGELGAGLAELVEHNHIRHSYEQGLQAVAEAAGLLKGLGEGLARFGESVGKVLQEQRRYSLADVRVPVPEFAIAVNDTWRLLQGQIKDEKQMGAQPLEFSRIITAGLSQRLPDRVIRQFFESMGAALNEAPAAWK